ncbi:YbaB/EbfC family nucleoid-associated protein [Nocardia sp. NPDC050710]|uniref:YbaB/EbfC family nucleoid-associated protein n=1 Tax=Nocardia sp. NPDC050710 TaxID=3157220 RepID=UPI0033FA04DB
MRNEQAAADMAAALETFQQQMAGIGRIQRQRAQLTATASARGKRVTVTVNADGTVIETKFSADIDDLSYSEIAAAITAAAQQAAAEITRKTNELMAPLSEQRSRLPKLADIVEGMPDVSSMIPRPQRASTAPPGAPERQADAEEESPTFADAEDYNQVTAARKGSEVTDSGW